MKYENQRIQLRVKVFENDLRDAIASDQGIDLNSSKKELRTIENFQIFFDKHLILKSEQLILPVICQGFSVEGDAYFINFESEKIAHLKINMMSDYLMDLFPSQQNILQFTHGEKKIFFIFKKGKENFEFNLSG